MSSIARRLFGAFLLLGALTVVLILFSGGASATPDSNNDISQAVEVHNWDTVEGSLSDLDDLEDYYKSYMESGEVLDYFLSMDSGDDFDLYLFNSDMILIGQSTTDNVVSGICTEQVTFDVTSTGWYYVSVYAYSGEGSYSLLYRSTASWTVMVYLDADNNLEDAGIADFLEMSAVGSTPDVNIVVQMDRIPGYDSSYGDWTGANRYRVEPYTAPDAATALSSLGEINMGDPDTLTDFMVWSVENFPANNYMVVLWDHGGSWYGSCWDDTDADHLTTPELRGAFDQLQVTYPGFKFDIIGFDACQMASMEVLYELAPYTDYFVASQLNEPGPGWNYAYALSALWGDPNRSALDLAMDVAYMYNASYSVPLSGYYRAEVSMGVLDAAKIGAVATALDLLADEMAAHAYSEHNYYEYVRNLTCKSDRDQVDLADMAFHLTYAPPSATVRDLALDLYNATLDAVPYLTAYDHLGYVPASALKGLSIYFPAAENYDSYYDGSGMDFISLGWEEMLNAQNAAMVEPNDPVSFASRTPESDPTMVNGTSLEFSLTLNNADADALSWVWFLDGYEQPATTNWIYTPDSEGVHYIDVMVWDGVASDYTQWIVTVVGQPDLVINGFWKYDSQFNYMDNITSGRPTYALISVLNQGDATSGIFNATFYLDGVPMGNWYMIDGLAPGASCGLVTDALQLSDPGMHVIHFLIDPDHAVDESNESNNNGAFALNVVPAQWTVLIYMDGDNNLEPNMVNNFLEMASVGSNAEVSVVVQFDRIGGYDDRYGDWTDCLRFYVESEMTPTVANAVQDLGEVNMGDDSTLNSFLQWGASTYQADRYIVVLKDHGLTWYGCCGDDTSSNDILSLTEMSFGLEAMVADIGGPIELLLLDDCLMGSVEVAAQFSGVASYAVVSETVGWSNNHDYASILSFLQADLLMSGEELALGIVDRMHLVDNATHITQCVAAYDLQRTDALIAALNQYLDDLSVCWLDDPGYLEYARLYSDSFMALVDDDLIDLYQFVWNTMSIAENDDLTDSGGALLSILEPANGTPFVLVYESTTTADFCHGVSAYFPAVMDDYSSLYESSGVFIDDCSWANMVKTYLTASPPLTFLILDGTQGSNGWYTSPVELDFMVYDPSSQGISALEYSFGGAWLSYSGPFMAQVDGVYQLYYRAIGVNGATEDVRVSNLFLDVSKPTASSFVDGYTLTISGSDAMSGLASLHYRIDGGPWQTYAVPFTVGEVGTQYTVEYCAVDVAGNVGTTLTVLVGTDDTVAPVTVIEMSGTLGENGWYIGNVTVVLSANDTGGSGLDGLYYRYGNGDWIRYTAPLIISTTGVTALGYYAVDNHGNTVTRASTISMDRSAPSSCVLLDGEVNGGWFNGTVMITLSASDVGSGASQIMYRTEAGDWETYVSPFQVSTDGITFLEWYSVDVAGNHGAVNRTEIRLDSIGPMMQLTVNGLGASGWGNAVLCTVTGTDAYSGLGTVMYRVDQGAWAVYSGPIGFNATGVYLVECYGVDNANNIGAVRNATCRLDVTAPVSLVAITGLTDGAVYYNSIRVGLNATDVGCGVRSTSFKLDNGPWVSTVHSFVLDVVGAHTMWYCSEDDMGNSEAMRSVSFTIVLATVPGQVTDIAVEIVDDGMNVRWTAPYDGGADIVSYQVYRERNGGPAQLIATCNGTSWYDGDVADGDVCAYYVVPVNILGDGVQSPTVTAELCYDPFVGTILIILVVVIAMAAVVAVLFLIKRR